MTTTKYSMDFILKLDDVEIDNARVLSIRRSVGGRASDTAIFEIRPQHTGVSGALQLTELYQIFPDRKCEISYDDDGFIKRLFWGRTTAGSVEVTPDGEAIRFTARCEGYMWSAPLWHRRVASRESGVASTEPFTAFVTADPPEPIISPLVFNPVDKGIATPNATQIGVYLATIDPESVNPAKLDDIRKAADAKLVLDPMVRASNVQGEHFYWTLTDIVQYLLGYCMRGFIFDVPARSTYESILGTDGRLIRDLTIDYGDYLPQILDDLLRPYGFCWWIVFDTAGLPTLTFAPLGDPSDPVEFKMQLPGQIVDFDLTDVEDFNADFDVSDHASNGIIVVGDYEYREGTFELVPAWGPEYDTITGVLGFKEFMEGSDSWETTEGVRRAWRDWVLNEAGDYTGLRPTITREYDFEGFFLLGVPLKTRKKFLETLAKLPSGGALGQDSGVKIEWSPDQGTNWYDVRADDSRLQHGSSFTVLQNECGVRFASPQHFPMEMYYAGIDNCRVRVTATIRNDHRIWFADDRYDFSLLSGWKDTIIDLKDRYRLRAIEQTNPKWKSKSLETPYAKLAEVDDRLTLLALAEKMVEASNHASLNGRVTRFGLYPPEEMLGKTIHNIEGRNILMHLNHATQDNYYPTVRAVEMDVQRQRTSYFLDTPRQRQ